MTTEEWRPVAGYEGSYEVSNLGRVKTLIKTLSLKFGVHISTICGIRNRKSWKYLT